jgi:hypothetical protein
MRFLVAVKATKDSEAGVFPPNSAELFEKMGKFNEELAKAGMLLAADGLTPSSKGVRISFKGGKPSVTDGPFAETKELIAGFWILQAKSRDEVVAWISRAPFDNGDVEIRQVFETEDLPSEVRTADNLERRRFVEESMEKASRN